MISVSAGRAGFFAGGLGGGGGRAPARGGGGGRAPGGGGGGLGPPGRAAGGCLGGGGGGRAIVVDAIPLFRGRQSAIKNSPKKEEWISIALCPYGSSSQKMPLRKEYATSTTLSERSDEMMLKQGQAKARR